MDVKTVPIQLDKERRLRMDFNALADFEEATGAPFSEVTGALTITQLRALLWACLRHEDEALTVRDVGAMIHPGNVGQVEQAVTALVESFEGNA